MRGVQPGEYLRQRACESVVDGQEFVCRAAGLGRIAAGLAFGVELLVAVAFAADR